MKTLLTLLVVVFCVSPALSQITAVVDFNNYVSSTNNDLTNRFKNIIDFYQVPTNGITGGSLKVPPIGASCVYKGAYYQSTSPANPLKVSLFFKMKKDSINTSNLNSVAIIFRDSSDTFVYDQAFYDYDNLLPQIGCGSYSLGAPANKLIDDHWYKFEASIVKSPKPDTLIFNVKLEDYGVNGTSTPILVQEIVNKERHTNIYNVQKLEIKFEAQYREAVKFIDNINITGNPTVGISEIDSQPLNVSIFPTVFDNSFWIEFPTNENKDAMVAITDMSGRLIFRKELVRQRENISMSQYPNGNYIVKVISGQKISIQKIIKQ